MNSLCTSAFIRELRVLVERLKLEGHPALHQFLPFYDEEVLRHVDDCWQSINCLREELGGMRNTIQQLGGLIINNTQQKAHNSSCFKLQQGNALELSFLNPLLPFPNVSATPTAPPPTKPRPKRVRKPKSAAKKTEQNGPLCPSMQQLPAPPQLSDTEECYSTSLQQLQAPLQLSGIEEYYSTLLPLPNVSATPTAPPPTKPSLKPPQKRARIELPPPQDVPSQQANTTSTEKQPSTTVGKFGAVAWKQYMDQLAAELVLGPDDYLSR